ncbi:MAG: FtsX-like permease family protein [Gemmatimonadetes bacterium]|nr:FtsX-like permease family protein [Gemmatimonadota bacterium]NIO31402.1 FtsX-like permease family protein [Gemmatimonadota bacterium]
MASGPWWRIGWRNLGRNRRRTLITAAGLAFGYLAVVVLIGLMDGLTAEMIESGTGVLSGQLQVHDLEYRPERKIYDTIGGRDGADVERLVREIAADPVVEAAAPRVFAGGLVSSGESTVAGILMGVDPELEPGVSSLMNGIVRGRAPTAGTNQILIGTEMARQLEVDVGDEVILVAPAADGSMGNDLYTVSGVYQSGMAELDGSYAVVPLGTLQILVALDPGRIHEIAASVTDPWLAPEAADRLTAALSPLGLRVEVAAWTELRPEMLDYAQLADGWRFVVIFIVFAIAIFGVANTMLMATYERRREIAVMLALGTTPFSIVRSVLSEALALGILSLAFGAAITLPVMFWFHNAPPDLSWIYGEYTIFGALIRPRLRVEYHFAMALWTGVALLITALLASLYPAARAARVPPADTLSGL